jgi:catechol 2,3-dioxygenase-like lactoylglutathione lyase family enzyme
MTDLELHHVAYVVDDLDESTRQWERGFGAHVELPATLVSAHAVLVSFLKVGDARIELVQPAGPNAATGKRPRQQGHADHLGFFCSDFDQRIERTRSEGGIVVRPPVPSEAFGGRRMCFVFYASVGLVEFIER